MRGDIPRVLLSGRIMVQMKRASGSVIGLQTGYLRFGGNQYNIISAMDRKIGLIKVAIRLIKKDEEQVDRIMKARTLDEEHRHSLTSILRHNVWTVKQFSDLTGLNESTITNKTRPAYRNDEIVTELDYTYPFTDLNGMGPKFIVRNEKSEALLP